MGIPEKKMSDLEPPYAFIRDAFATQRIIPFLGAGASQGLRPPDTSWAKEATFLPNGGELADHLASMAGFPEDEQQRDLPKVAQYFDAVIGRARLNEKLHQIFSGQYRPDSIHTFLARQARPLLVVTTNYDDMIECAFREEGHPFDLVIHGTEAGVGDRLLWWPHPGPDAPDEEPPIAVSANKLDIDLTSRSVIYKMHGAVDREKAKRDQYVITEDDYIDFLARMTKNRAVPAIFAELFQQHHFLFLGYGLYDWNLRVVLNRIEKDLRRPKGIKSWAIQQNPKAVERLFWEKRDVKIYGISIQEFLERLENGGGAGGN